MCRTPRPSGPAWSPSATRTDERPGGSPTGPLITGEPDQPVTSVILHRWFAPELGGHVVTAAPSCVA